MIFILLVLRCISVARNVNDKISPVENVVRPIRNTYLRNENLFVFEQLDQNNTAKLNVSKPRNDSIPYPDDKAPFHVPAKDPDPRRTDPSALGILHKHCLYSLALLLWILLSNKYCRPDYAETADVEHVFDAVAQENDVRYVSEWKVPDSEPFDPRWEALEIVTWSLAAWHDGLASWLYEFEMKITWLISKVLVPEERKIQKADQ